jgi:undecaprenyl-diphosphatase
VDEAIVVWLNGGVGRVGPFDDVMETVVSDYFAPVLGSLVLLALWFSGDDRSRFANQVTTATGTMAVGFANMLVAILNANIFRDRPFVDHDLTLLFYEPTDSSFPANATAVGFGLATAVFVRHRRLGLTLYALAFAWGFARVYAGVHYPTDVLTGAAIGIVAAFMAVGLMRLIDPIFRRTVAVFSRVYFT